MAKVHLVNPMRNPAGGSENRTISLFELLAEATDVQVWTEEGPHSSFLGQVPLRKIGPPANFPQGGNLVFVGTYFSIGGWLKAANPSRVILIHNLDQPDRLRQIYSSVSQVLGRRPEVVFSSEAIARSTPEILGVVHDSPIDLNKFQVARREDKVLTVGRLSRDVEDKHHPGDEAIYRRLVDEGVQVRLMGATCLGIESTGVEVLEENAEPANQFLNSLDVFFYRTHPAWFETFGRVIFEAMASGVPIVAESRHGYGDKLINGENALTSDSDEAAVANLLRLLGDENLRRTLSSNGRRTAESLYGESFREATQAFYSG